MKKDNIKKCTRIFETIIYFWSVCGVFILILLKMNVNSIIFYFPLIFVIILIFEKIIIKFLNSK